MDGVMVLTCPNCGAPLRITDGLERFACSHCGTEQIVKRAGGIVTLQPLMAAVSRVESATNRAAAELAIQRLIGEVKAAKAEVARLEKTDTAQVAPAGCGELVAQFAAFFGAGLLFVASLLVWPQISFLVLIVAGAAAWWFFGWMKRQRLAPIEQRLNKQWEAKVAELESLERQLAANQRIVVGQ